MRSIVERMRVFEGQAALVDTAAIDDRTAQAVVRQSGTARQTESALVDSSRRLLDHVRRELAHRGFSEVETRSLLDDRGKLWRWYEQICVRDFFASEGVAMASAATIAECELAIRDMRVGAVAR